jgi:hypothetical protein
MADLVQHIGHIHRWAAAHARCWSRRMVHETALHRVDAELALGVEPRIHLAVAVDGVGEFLENLPRSGSLRGNGEQLRPAATDQPVHWTITRDPTGPGRYRRISISRIQAFMTPTPSSSTIAGTSQNSPPPLPATRLAPATITGSVASWDVTALSTIGSR